MQAQPGDPADRGGVAAPRGGVDIVAYLRERATDPTYQAIVLAHPCSGTTWLTDVLNFYGVPTLHELVRPADPPHQVLITYRSIGFAPAGGIDVVHLVRNPIKTLESAAVLYSQRPRVARDSVAHILGCGHIAGVPPVGDVGPLAIAAWTLTVFNQRAEDRAAYRFRIEDAFAPAIDGLRRNSHTRGKRAEGMRWDDLNVFRDVLWTQYRRYGYEGKLEAW